MFSGLTPSIEIISTGAAWAPNAKTTAKTRRNSGKTKKRRRTAFMRSAPEDILMGSDEAVRTLKLNSQASGDEVCGEVYREQRVVDSAQKSVALASGPSVN